jgi:hypothetical protein
VRLRAIRHHRRLPERFFFLRGGGGGAPLRAGLAAAAVVLAALVPDAFGDRDRPLPLDFAPLAAAVRSLRADDFAGVPSPPRAAFGSGDGSPADPPVAAASRAMKPPPRACAPAPGTPASAGSILGAPIAPIRFRRM